jgi:hypothetical protein
MWIDFLHLEFLETYFGVVSLITLYVFAKIGLEIFRGRAK